MNTATRDLDIEQWIFDYMNSFNDSKIKSIMSEKGFFETLLNTKERKNKTESLNRSSTVQYF